MKTALRSSGIALGWTTLALTGLIEPMVGRGKHLALYHWDGSATALFGPVLLLFAAVWAGVLALLLSAAKPGRWRVTVWGAGLLSVPWLLANAGEHLFRPLPWLRTALFGLGVAALLVVLLRWRRDSEPQLEWVVAKFSTAMLAVGFSEALILLQIGDFWWAARGLNDPRTLHQTAVTHPGTPAHTRVIWIVFDELSYRQVHERRYPGLQLPAFDALAAESAVFTHVIPAGSKTDVVLPSLIEGKPIDAIRASSAGQLYTLRNGQKWQEFSQTDTVFQDALEAGYSTGVVGWYNPYCRILPAVLDHCFWSGHSSLDNGLSSSAGFGGNVQLAAEAIVSGRGGEDADDGEPLPTGNDSASEGHIDDYKVLLQQVDQLLDNTSVNFDLLHLPVPHPNGIFDRRTGEFAEEHATYLDNLVLADHCLAEMRARLEREGAWDSTAIVLMGDHSWRVNTLWRHNKQRWTPEEESASEGAPSMTGRPMW